MDARDTHPEPTALERSLLLAIARAAARTYGCPHTGRAHVRAPLPPRSPADIMRTAESIARFRQIAWARRHCAPWLEQARDD